MCDSVQPQAVPSAPDADPVSLHSFAQTLAQVLSGDQAARQRLWSEHYDHLRALVVTWFRRQGRCRANGAEVSIGPTHIVDELYLRLRDRDGAFRKGRRYLFRTFYNECARILIDHLRRTERHHEGRADETPARIGGGRFTSRLEILDDVIAELSSHRQVQADIAAMKIFESVPAVAGGGMRRLYNHEIAERLGVSLRAVEQHWRFAKSYLCQRLGRA